MNPLWQPDAAELRELDDPVRNARVGCARPLARSFGLTLLAIIGSAMGAYWLGSADWWLPLMGVSVVLLWLVERGRGEHKARERRALDRLLGIRRP